MGIGLLTYEAFLETVQKTSATLVVEKKVKGSFDWEEKILTEMKQLATSQSLSFEDLFKIMDKDFDGQISVLDLKAFLKDDLQVKE